MQHITHLQHKLYNSGKTKEYTFRKKQLLRLKKMLQDNESEIYQALKYDLNKSKQETYTTEIGLLYSEINTAIKGLKEWMKAKKTRTPLTHVGTSSFILQEPYGVVLVISPWNYPLQLALAPVIGAIAAGNCVTIKPSEYAQATSQLLSKMIATYFDPSYLTVIEGGKETSELLLKQAFDYIFFTGNSTVGKIVMKHASENLIPVTLELGGKSPVIVDRDANIRLAAKRIVWGKFTNAGQTCVAPDYVYVHKKIKKRLVKSMITYIKSFYSKKPLLNKDYVRIIHSGHFNRLRNLLSNGKLLYGGKFNEETLRIEPTLLEEISWSDPIMQEEIFGPILPILTFDKLDQVINKVQQTEKPLALYYFGNKRKRQNKVIQSLTFGGGCINDVLYHLANPHLPFGGVGESGIGSYHGIHGFKTFSHQKSILKQTNLFDLPFRYPGSEIKHSIVRKLMK